MSSEPQLKLPDFFPANIAACTNVSQEFFDCFSLKSEKTSVDDTEAGNRGLLECQKQLKAYENCMTANIPKVVKNDKSFRVRFPISFHLLRYVMLFLGSGRISE
jgi:hypothetical protein